VNETAADHRAAQRHRTLLGAKILFNSGHSVFDCLIRNLSDTGARLHLEDALAVPENFTLTVVDGRSFPCTVVWRKVGMIGVHFDL
jgi:hypothetical protein